jgi:serine/threonine protein kinase
MEEHTLAPHVYVKAVNQADQVDTFYLHLEGDKRLPALLGTGRNAVVFLATTTPQRESEANYYRAIKFLRNDIDKQYARASAERFFEEADKAKRFDRLQGTFVKYFGWGAVGQPEPPDEKGEYRDFWWRTHFQGYEQRLLDSVYTNNQDLDKIRRHFDLQGPFYVLDLCQGTLYDLLDKHTPWIHLPAYSIIKFQESLLIQTHRVGSDIDTFTGRYLERNPSGRSGYDILNDFKDEPTANKIRSYAALEIFRQIVYSVSELHKKKVIIDPQTNRTRTVDPLAHRDLKPGNIFFQHDANIGGLNHITIQLSDLGYVTNAARITSGDVTLRFGRKGIEYHAPGSQYYRAPEQAELPVEVRVDVDVALRDAKSVRVRGSKIDQIDMHDWLLLSDIFNDEDREGEGDPRLFKILEVHPRLGDSGIFYELLLDNSVDTSKTEDIQGQVIRSTGFQTDGFSLGTILYDLISGGKNPQAFYTYCVVSLTSQFDRQAYSVEDIVEVLAPKQTKIKGISDGEALNFAERRRMMRAMLNAGDLDNLLDLILEIAFNRVSFKAREQLTVPNKTKIIGYLWKANDIDDLVAMLIHSPFFANGFDTHERHDLQEQIARDLKEELKNYRFRNFHLVSDLLQDKRGVNIPRDILKIIVGCMVRDVEGSYYRCDPQKGHTSDASFDAATRIYDDVSQLMGEPQYRLPETGFPRSLEENLLFKLRSLAGQALKDPSLRAAGAPSAQE